MTDYNALKEDHDKLNVETTNKVNINKNSLLRKKIKLIIFFYSRSMS